MIILSEEFVGGHDCQSKVSDGAFGDFELERIGGNTHG